MSINVKPKGRNRWLIDVRVRYFEDGWKEKRLRETFEGKKTEAEARYIELRDRLRSGEPELPDHLRSGSSLKLQSFDDLVNLYLEHKPGLAKEQVQKIERLRKELGPVKFPDIPDRFDRLIKFYRTHPSKKTGRILKNSSINRYVEIVRSAYNVAVGLELVQVNPITKVRFPKLKQIPRDKVLTKEQTDRLFAAIKEHADYLEPVVKFALQVPCRRSELINMRKEDLDLIGSSIRVRNGSTKNDDGIWKPIPDNMKEYFRTLPRDTDYLFYRYVKKHKKNVCLGDFKKAWKKCLREAGITDFRFHDTRHISASLLVDNGTPNEVVKEVAGWRSDMLKVYYKRKGKQSLHLVRFSPPCGHFVDTSGRKTG